MIVLATVCSVVSKSLQTHGLCLQAPVSVEFSKQKYQSMLPFLTLGDHPLMAPGIESTCIARERGDMGSLPRLERFIG